MIKAGARGIFGYAQATRRISLRVRIDNQDSKVIGRKRSSRVNGGRSFPDSALLIGYRQDLSQAVMLSRFRITARFT